VKQNQYKDRDRPYRTPIRASNISGEDGPPCRSRAPSFWETALPTRQPQSCKKGRYAPPVHMIKRTKTREITACRWVHPEEDR